MPAGIQLGNLDRYRYHPFEDDSRLDCVISPAGGSNLQTIFPVDFIQAFRLVHFGVTPVSDVRLAHFRYSAGGGSSSFIFEFGFRFLDSAGVPIVFYCKDYSIESGTMILPALEFSADSLPDTSLHVFSIHDFNFSNCISVCLKANLARIQDYAVNELNGVASFEISSDIPMSADSVISAERPHVMSLLDDTGEIIRDKRSVAVVAGYNTKLDVISGTNTLLVSALRGAGAGLPCGESGLASGFSGSVVRKLNGISASPTGSISLSGGNGIAVKPIKGTNIINIYPDTSDRSSTECKI